MHHARRGGFDIGTAIVYGFGLAFGFALFGWVLGGIALLILAIWTASTKWPTFWRRTVRTLFVGFLVLLALIGLIALFE